MAKKEVKKRNEIRLFDIPGDLYKKLSKNADKEGRTLKNEVLTFLKKKYQ